MRACSKPEARAGLVVVTLACLLASVACSPGEAGGTFEIDAVNAAWSSGRLDAHVEQRLELSPTAREALRHGVPLTIELELILRREDDRTRIAEHAERFEIRYLPLSEHYQVSGGDRPVRTFPRLRHALAWLGTVEVGLETRALASGDYELLVRSRLDHGSMPPPMRLPALLDGGWAHESGWTAWPLQPGPGA